MNKPKSRSGAREKVAIPAREEIMELLAAKGTPMSRKQICAALGVDGGPAVAALRGRLKAMLRDGQVIRNRRREYGLTAKMDLVVGRLIGHRDGYGFVRPEDGSSDVFLPAREMRQVLHGDRVVVRIAGSARDGKRNGAVVEVLEHANAQVVGRFYREGAIGYVVPDNRRIHQDILIPRQKTGGAGDGQFVVVEIASQPNKHRQPIGEIVEVLGSHADPGIATELAIRAYELPYRWPKTVLKAAAALSDQDLQRATGKRRDLTGLPFVTIDGEDARDFDDAVHVERQGEGWCLRVAIADVSYFVKPGTALDEEARNRGTSVYFPNRVIPMLPEQLSNVLCSLMPAVNRFSVVCQMQISKDGVIESYKFYDAVIKSAARLTYAEVAALVCEKEPAARQLRAGLTASLDVAFELFTTMHDARRRQGLLDFSSTESRFEFDKNGNIERVYALARNDAHRLIEEFMLAANIAAADFLLQHELPVLFRNHGAPAADKIDDVREFLGGFGLSLGGGDTPRTHDYAELLEAVRSRDDAHLIETVLLRSLPLAVYASKNEGHFGLAFDAYTHFTSPIRRYPDLIVHRAIKKICAGAKRYPYAGDEMHALAEHCSYTERRAEEASRDVMLRLKCHFMQSRVGEIFGGRVTGVTSFGLFVEIDDLFIEGLVHVTSLPRDYYHYDAIRHQLVGERTGRRFRLSDKLDVRITRVDVDEKQIDFELPV